MGWKTVIDLNADKTVSFEKPGQTVEGFFVGSKEVKASFGPCQMHVLQTAAGNIGVWGSAQLDAKLKTVTPGALVSITYDKKIKVPRGSMKVFTVKYDEDTTIDVSSTTVTYEASTEPEEDDADTAVETASGDEEEAPDTNPEPKEDEDDAEEAAPPRAALKKGNAAITAEQQAKAKALLNRQRSKVA